MRYNTKSLLSLMAIAGAVPARSLMISQDEANDSDSMGELRWNVAQASNDESSISEISPQGRGLTYSITRTVNQLVRLELVPTTGDTYCAELTSDANTILWQEFRSIYWDSVDVLSVAYDPSVPLTQIGINTPLGAEDQISLRVDSLAPADERH